MLASIVSLLLCSLIFAFTPIVKRGVRSQLLR